MMPDTKATGGLIGSIELTINGKNIVDKELVDDIDWLWPFMVKMIIDLREGRDSSMGFPDQPIDLSFRKDKSGRIRVKLTRKSGEVETSAIKEQLVAALTSAGIEFFKKMEQLGNQFYSEELRELGAPGY